MKRYPYTQSTDMIIYEPKVKPKKKPKLWLACLSSALCASIITAGVLGGGLYIYSNNKQNNMLMTSQNSSSILNEMSTVSNNAGVVIHGKTVLSTEQIAAGVGPSVVGVINKAKMQAQRYFDPFSGRWYYMDDPSKAETVEQGTGS